MPSFALNLHDQSMFGAARGRLGSLRWRVILAFVFASAATLVLNTIVAPALWLGAMCAAMSFDYWLGKRYLAAETKARREFYGVLFIFACAATITVFASMTIWVCIAGGPPGRVLSVLMSASSLVSVMLFLFQAPVFMMITGVPCTICLAVVPLVPFSPSPASAIAGGFGLAIGIAAFLAYVARAAVNNGKMFQGLQAANTIAKERAEEAEAKRAEAEEANRAKSEFLTTMTHELRTPLNAVIGYSEIIEEDCSSGRHADVAEDARRISASARHLLGLIDQILRLSMLDSGRTPLVVSAVDVRGMVEGAVAGATEAARANGNRIVCRVAPNLPVAHTDGDKVCVCVAHLLSNAAKFTSNGLISLNVDTEMRDDRAWLRISVSDTGVGMAPHELAKAFQPFTQIDGSTTRERGGLGLGLTTTSSTAHLLGGDVTAVSEPGVGSTFTLRVPMNLEPTQIIRAAA